MAEKELKRITNAETEAKGFALFADEDWLVLKVDLKGEVLAETLIEYLKTRGIQEEFIQKDKISSLIEAFSKGEAVQKEVIAEGKSVRHGVDGHVEFLIDMSTKKVEVSDEDGNVDFRDLNLIKEIHSGEPVVKVTKADPGEEGMNLMGKVIAAIEGKKAKMMLGKNVRLDEATNTVYATKDGHVEYVDPLVSVIEDFVVDKDVDFTIGNLKFIGSLIFNKSIPEGYTMEAGKDIFVKGTVTGSNLIAKNNITVDNGIVGSDKTKIDCEGILTAKFINEAHAYAKGGVVVHIEVVRSKIRTNGIFNAEHGAIRGGDITALEGAKAKELGSPLGTPTYLAVGVDFSVDERIEKLNEAIEQLNEQIKKYNEAVEPFMKNKFLLLKAPESKKSAVKTILSKIEGLKKKIKQVEGMITEQESKRYLKTKTIEINGAILDDVTLQIGNKKKTFNNFGKRKGKILYDKTSFEIVFSKSA